MLSGTRGAVLGAVGAAALLLGYHTYTEGGSGDSAVALLKHGHSAGTGWTPPLPATDATVVAQTPAPPAFFGNTEVAAGIGVNGEFLAAGLRSDAEGVAWVNFTDSELRFLLSLPTPRVNHADDIATQVRLRRRPHGCTSCE